MKTLLLCIALLLVAGCGQVVLKDPNGNERFKANWILYDFKFNEVAYKSLQIDRFDGKAKNIKVITPSVIVESEDSE